MKPIPGLAVTVGVSLRRLRERAGMTQQQVADLMLVRRPTVTRLERGAHVPNLETLLQYVQVTGHTYPAWMHELDFLLHNPEK